MIDDSAESIRGIPGWNREHTKSTKLDHRCHNSLEFDEPDL